MSDFTSSEIFGFGGELEDDPANLVLKYIEDSWTLDDPPKYNSITEPFGVLFGEEYFGQHDFVCYALEIEPFKLQPYSTGGRLDVHRRYVQFCFTVRDYGTVNDSQIPTQIDDVIEFVSNLIDSNPRGLHNKKINAVWLRSVSVQNRARYGVQIHEIVFDLELLYVRKNIS